MRTTVIPAQITTVEDKIAGSLNLTQIVILMVPVFWTTLVYAILPPHMHLAWYKLPTVLVVVLICLILALRIKGKVVVSWLAVLFKYNLRPKYYVFNKNEAYLRELYMPEFEKKQIELLKIFKFKKAEKKKAIRLKASAFGMKELLSLRVFINNPNYSISLKPGKRGGLYVSLEQK